MVWHHLTPIDQEEHSSIEDKMELKAFKEKNTSCLQCRKTVFTCLLSCPYSVSRNGTFIGTNYDYDLFFHFISCYISFALFFSVSTGLGESKTAEAPAVVGEPAPAEFLRQVCDGLNTGPVVVISPSLSGMYSLPFLFQHSEQLKAYIPVAPICTDKFKAEQYKAVQVSVCVCLCSHMRVCEWWYAVPIFIVINILNFNHLDNILFKKGWNMNEKW